MQKFFNQQFHEGFTLIETLFAILIFSAALIALMTIAGRGISAAANAAQTTTASYLAQEGLEVGRNIRDTNYAANGAWDAGLATCVGGCSVVYGSAADSPTLSPCSGSCPLVKQDLQTAWYGDTGSDSQYRRTVTIKSINPVTSGGGSGPSGPTPAATADDEYLVTSQVTWTSKSIPRTVTLSTIVKNWH